MNMPTTSEPQKLLLSRALFPSIKNRAGLADLLAVTAPVVASLAIGIYTLSCAHVLLGVDGYDDGVYLGDALRLIDGVIPYRDFVMVHPPGIAILLAPIALLGHAFGLQTALAASRILTVLVAAANCGLAAICVRHRGRLAALAAGSALACFPMAPAADQTLLLEPYLAFFCLLAIAVMFSHGHLASNRRVLVAGILLGVACSVKLWAGAVIVVALLAVLGGGSRGTFWRLACGILVGILVPCLPFFLLAPRAFVHDVVLDQLGRLSSQPGLSTGQRLFWISGLPGVSLFHATEAVALIVGAAFAVAAGLTYLLARARLKVADWFVAAAAVAVVLELITPHQFYAHYAYFAVVFVALLLGTVVGLVASFRPASGMTGAAYAWARYGAVAIGFAVVAIGLFSVTQEAAYARTYVSGAFDPSLALDHSIPVGSCVVSDEAIYQIVANRFDSAQPCPTVVDPYGAWLASFSAHPPPYVGPFPTSFVRLWEHWLEQADYVTEVAPRSDFIPWTPALTSWFAANYSLSYRARGIVIYQHTASAGPPPAA